MAIGNKIKEAAIEYTVYAVLGFLAVLVFIIWQSVPSEIWERISNAVEKRVLWAIIGILIFIVFGLFTYLIQNYLKARTVLHHSGGVLWNSNSEIFCPKDETPLFQAGNTFSDFENNFNEVELFQCPKCDSNFILKDAKGNMITLTVARRNFLMKQSLEKKGSINPIQYEETFDDVTITILSAFAGTTTRFLQVENFTGLLSQGTKPARISHSLEMLHKKGFLTKGYPQTMGQNTPYELTDKGRTYIVENKLA